MKIRLTVLSGTLRPVTLVAIPVLMICVIGCLSNTRILDNYREATVFPEKFDSHVRMNSSLYNVEFFNCLEVVKGLFQDAIYEKNKFCEILADPESKRICKEKDVPQQIFDTLSDIETVIRHGTPYGETIFGASALQGKTAAGETNWMTAQIAHIDVYEEFLLCQ